MKKVFSSNSELAHVWAQQIQDYGTANNMTFKKDTIYSYGYWPMAKFMGPDVVLFRNWVYSSSTGRHMDLTRSALHSDVKIIYVDDPADVLGSIRALSNEVKESYNSFDRERNKLHVWGLNNAAVGTLAELKELGFETPDLCNYNIDNESAMLREMEEQEKTRKERKAEREAERVKLVADFEAWQERNVNFEDLRNLWRSNKDIPHVAYPTRYQGLERPKLFTNPGLRLNIAQTEVHTSAGARVPVREAKILLDRIRTGKDIKGFKIGYYTVISLNGTLKIGCHNITRKEIDIFCALNNW